MLQLRRHRLPIVRIRHRGWRRMHRLGLTGCSVLSMEPMPFARCCEYRGEFMPELCRDRGSTGGISGVGGESRSHRKSVASAWPLAEKLVTVPPLRQLRWPDRRAVSVMRTRLTAGTKALGPKFVVPASRLIKSDGGQMARHYQHLDE